MKYIITENRLNDIIFKYLDSEYGALKQKKGKYVDIVFYFPDEERKVFPDEEYDGVLGWRKSGDLYISYDLRNTISNYFGLEKVDSLEVISKWAQDRYNLKVIDTMRGNLFINAYTRRV